MKVNLENRAALVTGSAKSIGRAIALSLAKEGADVVVNDLDEGEGRRVADEIRAMGRRSLFVKADVSDSVAVNKMIGFISDNFGRLEILVNNAGINVGISGRVPFPEFSEADWRRIIDVDLNGVFYCGKAVAKQMIKQKRGKIINISSVAGIVPLRLQVAYDAAKAGVINLTRAMALELAPHDIQVNTIAPGSTLTEETKKLFYSDPNKAQKLLSHVPLGRPAQPEDIANAALFLASDDSNYITGIVLPVDGGWTCGYTRDW